MAASDYDAAFGPWVSDLRPMKKAMFDLKTLLAKSRAWKALDVTKILKIFEMFQGTMGRVYVTTDPAHRQVITRDVLGSLCETLPHFVREIAACAKTGRTPTGVSLEQLVKCLDSIRSTAMLPGFDVTKLDVNFESPELRATTQQLLGPMMEFTEAILNIHDNVAPLLSRNASLRHAVSEQIRHLFSVENPPLPMFYLCPNICGVITRLLEAIDERAVTNDWLDLAHCAYALIDTTYKDLDASATPPPALEQLVVVLLRSAMRVGLKPNSDEQREVGMEMMVGLRRWCRFHERAHGDFMAYHALTFEHLTAFPLILLWSLPELNAPEWTLIFIDVLHTWCRAYSAITETWIACMTGDEATLLLQHSLKGLQQRAPSPRAQQLSVEILSTLFCAHVPHNADFVNALDSPVMLRCTQAFIAYDTPNMGAIRAWPLVAFTLSPQLLAAYLKASPTTAGQALLDMAITLRPDPFFEANYDDKAPGRHNLAMIHFALHVTAHIEGIKYDGLLAHVNNMVVTCRKRTTSTTASPRVIQHSIDIITFLVPLTNGNDELGAMVAAHVDLLVWGVALVDMQYDPVWAEVLSDAPVLSVPWNEEGWQLRSRLIDLLLVCFFNQRESDNRDLPMGLSATIPRGDHGLHLAHAAGAVARFAAAIGHLTPVAEEFACLALWTYCSICLPFEPEQPTEQTLSEWRAFCSDILRRGRRGTDMRTRTREAAREILRLTEEKV